MKIVFVKSDGSITDRIISWWTKSPYVHCFLHLNESIPDNSLILESTFYGGVKFNILSAYTGRPTETFQTRDPFIENISCLYGKIGDEYGYLEILGFGLSRLLRLKKNLVHQGEICSQLVALWLKKGPLAVKIDDLSSQTPASIYQFVNSSSAFRKILI